MVSQGLKHGRQDSVMIIASTTIDIYCRWHGGILGMAAGSESIFCFMPGTNGDLLIEQLACKRAAANEDDMSGLRKWFVFWEKEACPRCRSFQEHET